MNTRITTPVGRMGFCALDSPNTKYNADGTYIANVIVDPAGDFAKFRDTLEKAEQEFRSDRRISDKVETHWPFQPTVDRDTKEETGEMTIKSKLSAVQRKTRDGPPIPQRVVVLDAGNPPAPLIPCPAVGPGSTVQVAGEFRVSYVQAQDKVFVSLEMKAIRVLDLVEYGTGYKEPEPFKSTDYDFGSIEAPDDMVVEENPFEEEVA